MVDATLLPLENAYDKYRKGRIGKGELESIIFSFILKHPRRFRLNRWHQDESFDYLCWVYPRLSKAIDRYKDQGSSFDAYIASVIRLAFREFLFIKKDQMAIESSWWNAHARDSYAASREPDYITCDIKKPVDKKIKNQKQIFLLMLKCYYFLSEDFIDRIAPALNIDKKEIIMLIDNLHRLRKHQEEEIMLLRERINSQYYRCICFESRMQTSEEGSSHYERMKRCLEKGRARLHSMRKHLSHMRLNASNSQLAELLGIPKGTIDSSLYALKEKTGNK